MNSGSKTIKRPKTNHNVEPGSGNVYQDLGLPQPDELLARAKLVSCIGSIIEKRNLTQAEAARLLGIDQPKVSAMLRGKFEGFSSDRLFRFLNALGQDVEIVIRPSRNTRMLANTKVVTA